MSFSLLQRALDPRSHTQRRTVFEVAPEGNGVLDQDLSLKFGVVGTISGGAPAAFADLTPAAGAFGFINELRVSSSNGVELLRLRECGKYAAFQGLRHGQSDVYGVEQHLSGATNMVSVASTIATTNPIGYRDPTMTAAATTREYMLDLRKLATFLRGMIDLPACGALTVEILWEQGNDVIWADGSGTVTAHSIDSPQLLYDIMELPKGVPRPAPEITYSAPYLAQNRIESTANGTTQRVVLPLGFGGEYVSGLVFSMVADVANGAPFQDKRSNAQNLPLYNLRFNGKQMYPQDIGAVQMLSELEVSEGRLMIPAGCYESSMPSSGSGVTVGTGAPRGFADYGGCAVQSVIDEQGLDLIFQRTGTATAEQTNSLFVYVWAKLARRFMFKKGQVMRAF